MKKFYKSRIIAVYLACQMVILLTYSLSGIWKIESGVYQLMAGQIGSFHPQAMAYTITGRLLETNSKSIFGDFFINNTFISWPLYLGAIYLESVSILIIFKTSLYRLWAGFLITMHIFIYLTMTVLFSTNIFLLGLFFLNTPYTKEKKQHSMGFESLPIIGIFIFRLMKLFNI